MRNVTKYLTYRSFCIVLLIDGKIDEGDEMAVAAAAAAAAPDIVRSIWTYATGSIICVCQIVLAGSDVCSGGIIKFVVVVAAVVIMDDNDEKGADEIADMLDPEYMVVIAVDPLANMAAAAASFSFCRLANFRTIASSRLPQPSRLRRL